MVMATWSRRSSPGTRSPAGPAAGVDATAAAPLPLPAHRGEAASFGSSCMPSSPRAAAGSLAPAGARPCRRPGPLEYADGGSDEEVHLDGCWTRRPRVWPSSSGRDLRVRLGRAGRPPSSAAWRRMRRRRDLEPSLCCRVVRRVISVKIVIPSSSGHCSSPPPWSSSASCSGTAASTSTRPVRRPCSSSVAFSPGVLLLDPAVPPRAPRGPMIVLARVTRAKGPLAAQARDLIDCSHMTVRRACRPGPTEEP